MDNLSDKKEKPKYKLVDVHTINELIYTIDSLRTKVSDLMDEDGDRKKSVAMEACKLYTMITAWRNAVFQAVNCELWEEKVKEAGNNKNSKNIFKRMMNKIKGNK